MKNSYVYILASGRNGTIYIGVTSNLQKRIWIHKNDIVDGFTKKYKVHRLVYCELHDNMIDAIKREKYLKGKSRKYKLKLIEDKNPSWSEISIMQSPSSVSKQALS